MENEPEKILSEEVILHFDEVLLDNINYLDNIDIFDKAISLNLATIASLLLVVDKETEIQDCNEASAKRYSRKTILNDLSDIGLEIDDNLMASIQNLVDNKYFITDGEGSFHPDLVAHEVVANLNKIFPAMQGMNLVAYIIQTIDEVITGRKEFDSAVSQFDKTLRSQGKPLSFVHLRTKTKIQSETEAERKQRIAQKEESKKISEQLKAVFSSKLAQLREEKLSGSAVPEIVTHRKLASDDVRIKEVSPKKVKEAKERAEKERRERERAEQEEQEKERLEQERIAAEAAEQDRLKKEEEESARAEAERIEKEKRQQEKDELDALRREREELERLKQELEAAKQSKDEKPTPIEENISEQELSVEEQIAAFEQELTIGCPLCEEGQIKGDSTDDGKEYYKCSNKRCRFISWSRPFHYKCPVCSNPYLIEFYTSQGQQGLKCPRAACAFSQAGIDAPQTSPAPSQQNSGAPKKRRVVRRKRR